MKLNMDCRSYKSRDKDGVINKCHCHKDAIKFKKNLKFINSWLKDKYEVRKDK